MSVKSNENAERPRVVSTLEIELKIFGDFEADR
jgi:hypothetical protein